MIYSSQLPAHYFVMGDKVDQAYASTLKINHYQPDKNAMAATGRMYAPHQ
jgi:hypothetical protein